MIDDKTCTLHLDRVTFDYYRYVPDPLPAHIDRAIFEAAPAEYRNRTAYDSDTTNPALAKSSGTCRELPAGRWPRSPLYPAQDKNQP